MAAPIERFLHEIVSPRADDTLGSLIDRIITDDDYDISMARTLADAIYNTYISGFSEFSFADDLKKVLIAIPTNECHMTPWYCMPRFASEWGVKKGEIAASGAIMYFHNAARSNWLPFTRGRAKIICNGSDYSGNRMDTYEYGDETVAATFGVVRNQPDETQLKKSAGIPWFASETDQQYMCDLEIHPTASTHINVISKEVTLVKFNSDAPDGEEAEYPGFFIEAVMNMPVPQRAELLQYLLHMIDGKAKPFTFEGIVRRALQRRIDTATIDGIYMAVRGMNLKPAEEI